MDKKRARLLERDGDITLDKGELYISERDWEKI